MVKIEGIATFTKGGFKFDSGLPADEPLLKKQAKLHGTLIIEQNGSTAFRDNGRVYLPPRVNKIGEGDGYKVRRTSQNYIVSIKIPIVEKQIATEQKITEMIPLIIEKINNDRKELIN